jgi:choline dehydrogenase
MGAADDPSAVTDPRLRVRGVDALYVADASVMPHIPRCNLNLPTLMIGERAAELVRREL